MAQVWQRFMGTVEICKQLGISRSHLYRLRKQGILKPITHYWRSGDSTNSPLLWDLETVGFCLRCR